MKRKVMEQLGAALEMPYGIEQTDERRDVPAPRVLDRLRATRCTTQRCAKPDGVPRNGGISSHLRVNEALECDFIRESREQRVVLFSPHDENHPDMRSRGQ